MQETFSSGPCQSNNNFFESPEHLWLVLKQKGGGYITEMDGVGEKKIPHHGHFSILSRKTERSLSP